MAIGKHKTKVIQQDNLLSVRYHSTEVFCWHSGIIKLDNGGYRTFTTKRRINQAFREIGAPYSLYQHKREWYVYDRKLNITMPFTNGMVLLFEK